MNELNDRQRALHFIALQMSDEMPMNARRQRSGFAPKLLRPVLAEMKDTGVGQQCGDLRRNSLGDRDERDLVASPTGTSAGCRDALLDTAKPLRHKRQTGIIHGSSPARTGAALGAGLRPCLSIR